MSARLVAGTPWLDSFERLGFTIVDGVLTAERVAMLIESTRAYATGVMMVCFIAAARSTAGRDLLWRVPEVRSLAGSPEILKLVHAVLGQTAFPVRGLFFDKTLTTNWSLPWHQDLTIAVAARRRAGVRPVDPEGGHSAPHRPGRPAGTDADDPFAA